MLDEALRLWRGPALAEFAFDDFARTRSAVSRSCGSTRWRTGRACFVSGATLRSSAEFDALVASNPLRERLRAKWMLALYRSGRQAEALCRPTVTAAGCSRASSAWSRARSSSAWSSAILAQDPELATPPAPAARRRSREASRAESNTPRCRAGRWVGGGSSSQPRVGLVLADAAVLVSSFARGDAPRSSRSLRRRWSRSTGTNRVVASIPAGSKPARSRSGDGAIWVGDAQDGTVTAHRSRQPRVVKTIGIGAPAIGLATGAGNVWVATGGFGDGRAHRLPPRRVTRRIELGEPGRSGRAHRLRRRVRGRATLGRRLRRARTHRSRLGGDHAPSRSRPESGSRHRRREAVRSGRPCSRAARSASMQPRRK